MLPAGRSVCYAASIMMARNHIPFGMASYWLVALACKWPIDAHSTMTAAIGALTPDLDHPRSALGRRLPFISLPLSRIFGHRGFTHSLLAAFLLFLLLLVLVHTSHYTSSPSMAAAGQGMQPLLIPFIIGYLSHILGDSLTPSGVPLFWPRKRTYSFNLFKTWSWQETAFVGVFVLSVVFIGGVAEAIVGDILHPSQTPVGGYFYGLRVRPW